MNRQILAATTAAVAATAVTGSLASRAGARSRWYESLDTPRFQPPPAVFPAMWTPLYGSIAVASARSLDRMPRGDPQRSAYIRAFAANLSLNAGWTWIFFRAHRLPEATVAAAALTVSSAGLALRSARVDQKAGLALGPYAVWCAFATVLSGSIWHRNRGK